jgi:hypothetical protein
VSVALSGDITERLRESVAYMHRYRRRTVLVRRRIVRREENQIRLRYRNAEQREPSVEEVDVLLDRVVSESPDFQAAVSNEQWGVRLTTAYALLRVAEQNDEVIALLRRIAATLDRVEAVEIPPRDL